MINHSAESIFPHKNDGDTVGGRLSRAREAAGLTLADLASHAGVRKETVAQWERDRSEPRANKLVMLAGILNVTPTWLMTGAGDGPYEHQTGEKSNRTSLLTEVKRLQAELAAAVNALERELTV